MEYFALYIGDLRFTDSPIGKFYFDYDENKKMFYMRSDYEISYPLSVVVGDENFLLFKVTADKSIEEQTIEQVDKLDFILEQINL